MPSPAALSGPGDTLLDEAGPEVCIDQSALCPIYCLAQSPVANAFIARKP
jgi:hypothetical protein